MKTLETISKISPNFVNNGDLIVVSRKEYSEFLFYQKSLQKTKEEERDTNEAIRVYKKEKKEGKLRKLKSLAELD